MADADVKSLFNKMREKAALNAAALVEKEMALPAGGAETPGSPNRNSMILLDEAATIMQISVISMRSRNSLIKIQ